MYSRSDPRFRRTLNTISTNFETANETAQEGILNATENCLKPCFASIGQCLRDTEAACGARRDPNETWWDTCFARGDARRRQRLLTRNQPEDGFDFYDDWAEDDALLAGDNEEFDRLLGAGEYTGTGTGEEERQPRRRGIMDYGATGSRTQRDARPARRKSGLFPYDEGDPTLIPNQSVFGFLGRLPFQIGKRALRYKPSAETLQERRQRSQDRGRGLFQETIRESGSEESARKTPRHTRKRSGTASSGATTDTQLSSRNDIFPSDDEDDAVPLDDEFAVALEHRAGDDDASSGKSRLKRPSGASSRTPSTRSIARLASASARGQYSASLKSPAAVSPQRTPVDDTDMPPPVPAVPSIQRPQADEAEVENKEEVKVESKQELVRRLSHQSETKPREVPPADPLLDSPPPPGTDDSDVPLSSKHSVGEGLEMQLTPKAKAEPSDAATE